MQLQNRIVFSYLVHVTPCGEGSFGNIQLSAGTNHIAHLQPRNFESCKLGTAYAWLQLVFQAFIGRKGKAIWMNGTVNRWWVCWWRDERMEWGKAGCIGKSRPKPTRFRFLWENYAALCAWNRAKFFPYQDLEQLVLHDWFCQEHRRFLLLQAVCQWCGIL